MSRRPEEGARYAQSLSVLGVTNVLLRHRWLVAGATALVVVAAIGRGLAARRVYASSATFVPAGRRAGAGSALSGLAAQFGVSVPASGGDMQQSPEFYVSLVHTRAVQDDVLEAQYAFVSPTGPYSGTLLDYYGGALTPLPQRRDAALRALDGQIGSGMDLRTGVVTLTVRSFSATLAAAIARNVLAALDRFNRSRAEAQAALERRFMGEQVDSAAAGLRAAEARLEAFQEQNKDYTAAPRLSVEYQRLQQDVEIERQLYASTSLAYAQARMDAARDNPAVTVIESPEVAAGPERRRLARTGVIALLAGLSLGALLAFVREHVVRTRHAHPDEEAEFAQLLAASVHDLTSLARRLLPRRR